ncbi:thiol reductant ABC exporter subunit CydD [Herbiconiux sp. L3-i23]|uniref:thiol reductant ABC exporter subunit CydD n=1 Tax=Herbiconiux sp. L3-i23 TaxID=2905871 RepID=UPI0020515EF1|nr:thiol reductant ABC exporter subunit CydD [Herbiconiux sp. L3-i23]BDI23119.1 thiol reductant ABC exporter subunit CydC [Herbiconiux sp. L3-i23]
MRSPFAAGFGPGGARTLYVLGLLAAVKAAGLLGIAEALARGISSLFDGSDSWRDALLLGFAAVVARAAAAWLTQWYATRASLGAKETLRAQLTERMLEGSDLRVGEATTLATRGLDDLDPYYRTVLPTAIGAAVIPLAVGARILSADWLSALIVVLTVPLIPVFMILIGQYTRDRVDAAAGALSRLADHLVELARGLPVLVGLGRVDEQSAALHRISEQYRVRTLATLRTAFLSSLALELIATISVAVVAVTVGIRLVNGDMDLGTGLLVLILAPECYTPLREVGVAFHASQDGVAALDRVRAALDRARPRRVLDRARSIAGAIEVDRLHVVYAGREDAAVDRLSFDVSHGERVALVGRSGAGKSTVLRVLAGRLDTGDGVSVDGTVVTTGSVAWLPQHPSTVGETVEEELRLYTGDGGAARRDELVDALGLAALLRREPAELSPGELRRVAFARALLRVEDGATVLLLDEPTAHLDSRTARIVERLIAELGAVTVVLVSHDPRVVALADRVITVDGSDIHGSGADVVASAPTDEAVSAGFAAPAPAAATDSPLGTAAVLRLLAALFRPVAGRLAAAVALGALAAMSAAALTAVSGWLIVRAAEQPAIMYLLVAIVGVRFFGIARSVLRYSERLVTHDAVFGSVTTLRDRLWSAIAARGTASPALRRGGTALDLLVVTADQVRDLAPRVLLPPFVALATGVASLIAVALLHPAVLAPMAAVVAVCLLIAPAIALAADRRASADERALRARAARRLASTLTAADDLSANAVADRVREGLAALDAEAGREARRSSWALGLGNALTVAALGGAAVAMIALAAPAVVAGTLPVEVVGVLALLPLGLIDPMLAAVEAVQQWPALAGGLRRLGPVLEPVDRRDDGALPAAPSVGTVTLDELSARWPGADAPAFAGVTATAARGEWLAVSGPSGSGKTTLLSVLLRYLDPAAGRYSLDDRDALSFADASVRERLAWCPQEAHLFSSTIRGNLLLARPSDDRPDEAELHEVLSRVGLGPLVEGMSDGLDTLVGDAGANLSGGERQRLAVARALLSRADVVLLDEPTAHLDAPTAAQLMGDLREALADRAVVLVSHRPDDFRLGDRLLDLSTASESVPASR